MEAAGRADGRRRRGALTIPPVLNLLGHAYGFGEPSLAHPQPLPAPQALLISALAKGVLTHDLDWSLIGIGVGSARC